MAKGYSWNYCHIFADQCMIEISDKLVVCFLMLLHCFCNEIQLMQKCVRFILTVL